MVSDDHAGHGRRCSSSAKVRIALPQTIRIVLSGDQSPVNHVRSAAVAHRFLQKPVDLALLKKAHHRAG